MGKKCIFTEIVFFMQLSRYPVGIQDFKKLRSQGCVYVDKTADIYELTRNFYVFLSRPRRFGKSLLSSTLKYYFQGEKELFEGLAIEYLETEWKKYPVFHFDLSTTKNKDVEGVVEDISGKLSAYELHYDIEFKPTNSLGQRLASLLVKSHALEGERAVVIIDEYDAPLLDTLHNEEDLSAIRKVMQEFYTPLKANDGDLRFVFITGITKFSQMSIFSVINNLQNLSMLPKYSTICGITEPELKNVFAEDINVLAQKHGCTVDEMLVLLKDNYDGYHFAEDMVDIYNPFSILSAFSQQKIQSYWFASGTPTFLIEQLRYFGTDITAIDDIHTDASSFDRPTEALNDPFALLYQSGYLTIKDYDRATDSYVLGIPNKEVRVGLMDNMLPVLTKKGATENSTLILKMYSAFAKRDLDTFFEVLKAYFAGIPYVEANEDLRRKECFYETIIYVVFSMMNRYVQTQVKTARGRVDVVMHTSESIYIMELKLDGSADEALKQIEDKQYLLPYSMDEKHLVKVGINFSSKTRTISEWKVA